MARIYGISLPRRLPRRALALFFLLIVIVFMVRLMGNSIEDDEEWYKHPDVYYSELACQHDEFTQRLFDELTLKMKLVFEKLNVRYFLCYGSLWGALRYGKTLPWDRNIDMCVVYHEIASINEQTLYQTFKQNELSYYYNSRRGKYVVTYKSVQAEITVFEKVGTHMERIGWEKRLFPHLYVNYQNFPFMLVEKDLPKIKFNGVELTYPHQEYEIQKYLYPDNWWKEVKPRGCV